MHLAWSTLALQTVNFLILAWLLQRFLYKPVLRLIDARRAEIDSGYAEAEKARQEAAQRLAAIEGERAAIAAERTAALREATAQIAETEAARRRQTERDCAELMETARRTLDAERREAMEEMRRSALDLGTGIAKRLLAELPPSLRAEAWLARVERQLDALPAEQREDLRRQVGEGGGVDIVTAMPLPAEAAARWRDAVEKRLGAGDLRFLADEALFAGAELRFPHAIIRVSWQNLLASLDIGAAS